MKLLIKKGSTDKSVLVFIQDSASTVGAGKTGLTYEDLTCYYARPSSAEAHLQHVTQTVTGAHTDGGFVEIDATNMAGFYRLDLSDAILATGVDSVVVMLKGTGIAPLPLEIQLTDFDINASLNDIADAILKRDWTSVSGEASRSLLNAARFLRNKWTIIEGILSVKKEDDSTEAWASQLTTSSGANPVTGSDPT